MNPLQKNKITIWVTLFALAMGLLECAVVIYLRELYYKDGFQFPLRTMPAFLGQVEVWREAATVLMLIAVGILAGNSKLKRFAYFVYDFAIWDLFYYIFLYIFIGWPQSLSTWDILFLIPAPWVGPVWAPCLLCLIMIAGSLYIIHQPDDSPIKINALQWTLMIGGACICIISFMWDYLTLQSSRLSTWNMFSSERLFEGLQTYIPETFNSGLFFSGFMLMCLSIILSIYKTKYA